MEIVKLPPGVPATVQDDCLRIQQMSDGQFDLTGNLLATCEGDDETESVSLIASEPYPDYEAAEAAGVAWADGCGVERIHVTRSAGTAPLPEPI